MNKKSNDDKFNKDLESFLKAHNIKDGNLTETRRIDLRASQHQTFPTRPSTMSKIESIFENALKPDRSQKKTESKGNKLKTKLKFLNESSSSSSSECSSDEQEDNGYWIERYRKQKLNLNSNK